ncbi:Hemerythrin HHE cation binding domain protein [Anaeromyxobacter sp. K]|uniref:hemerythrin domain-containing protein n=1 Tax=Anaeromyxobacter sp. (strain K) TaxID=447217 RepID=UPI00015F997B|nr:hemerythrin domain-containing protein [Anaeromyxobacter sp. K]ACG73681.1 Hemerythrin HHE cation binding domain protein [Anaeromyxobacter sp. K]
MDAIETLMGEHRVIEQVCDALVGFAEELRRKGATEKEELGRFVTFLREFADGCHHGKEEDILFRTMTEHGFPSNGGPIAVMLHEHDQGRALIRAMAEKAAQDAPWSAADLQEVEAAAHGYSGLLHAHIHKEDAILYPMAEQHLPPEVMAEVGAACDRFEAERTGAGAHERYHALAEELIRRHAGSIHPGAQPSTAHRFGCAG